MAVFKKKWGVYTGETQNGLFHGKGRIKWKCGFEETGVYRNAQRHGKFVLRYFNGSVETVSFVNGKRDGVSKTVFLDKSYEEVTYRKGKPVFTAYYFKDGTLIKSHEYSEYTDDQHYTAKYTYRYLDGVVMSGTLKNDEEIGDWLIEFPFGDRYEGEVKNSLQHGKGIRYSYFDNIKEEGIYENGKCIKVLRSTPLQNNVSTPNVTLELPNGDRYEGEVKNGKPHGKGIMNYHTGERYVGFFKNGLRWGYGENKGGFHGYEHTGYWAKDYPHGIGRSQYDGGYAIYGKWNYGEISNSLVKQVDLSRKIKFCYGKYKGDHFVGIVHESRNGCTYFGKLKDGLWHGKGVMHDDANGHNLIYKGNFKAGKKNGKFLVQYDNEKRLEQHVYKDDNLISCKVLYKED